MNIDIRINGRTVNSSRPVYIGVEADNNVLDLVFTGLPEIGGGQLVTLNWLTDGDEPVGDIEAMSKTEAGYSYTVKSGLTQFAGRTVRAYIEVKSGDKSWHTDPFLLDATALPEVEATLEPTDPTIIQQVKDALEQANAAATRAEEAAKRAEEAGGGGGIDEEQLQEAVESALEEAKASGEFDGPQGPAGPAGQPGQSGVHVGPDEPTDPDVNVWVDPDGEPDPFPVASADTLGGVKVGNGLQMDGEVLGVVPEGKMELIETITITEENAGLVGIIRTAEPDGTPYKLSRLTVRAAYTIATANASVALHINDAVASSGATQMNVKNAMYNHYNANISNGVIEARCMAGISGWNHVAADYPLNYAANCLAMEAITKIRLYVIGGTCSFPVGSVIEILGVRA